MLAQFQSANNIPGRSWVRGKVSELEKRMQHTGYFVRTANGLSQAFEKQSLPQTLGEGRIFARRSPETKRERNVVSNSSATRSAPLNRGCASISDDWRSKQGHEKYIKLPWIKYNDVVSRVVRTFCEWTYDVFYVKPCRSDEKEGEIWLKRSVY